MKKYAIWKDKKVVGYIEMTEEQRNIINSIQDIGIYIGFDKATRPEMYCKYDGTEENFECTEHDCESCPVYMMQ